MPFPTKSSISATSAPIRLPHERARRTWQTRPALWEGTGVGAWLDSLPHMLGASDLRSVARAIVEARAVRGGIHLGVRRARDQDRLVAGAGGPRERGFVSAFAPTAPGSFMISRCHRRSHLEDVDQTLGPGQFGMADETGRLLNKAINDGAAAGLGIGQAVGGYLVQAQAPYARLSVAASAAALGYP